jgi:hypothetical protein
MKNVLGLGLKAEYQLKFHVSKQNPTALNAGINSVGNEK